MKATTRTLLLRKKKKEKKGTFVIAKAFKETPRKTKACYHKKARDLNRDHVRREKGEREREKKC